MVTKKKTPAEIMLENKTNMSIPNMSTPRPTLPKPENKSSGTAISTKPLETQMANQPRTEYTKVYDSDKGFQGLRTPDGSLSKMSEATADVVLNIERQKRMKAESEAANIARIQADIDNQRLKEQMIAAQTPANVTAEQLGQVGQPIEANPFSELNTGIERNIEKKQQSDQLGILAANKYTAFAEKAIPFGIGSELMNFVSGQNKELRNWLKEYSNEGNFKAVKDDIQNAQSNMRLAITIANQPGNSQDAIQTYNEALGRLEQANAQMKRIESEDQRAYVDEIKRKRIELENFLTYNVPDLNTKMRNALIKPDPNYYDTEVAKIVTGGVVNG